MNIKFRIKVYFFMNAESQGLLLEIKGCDKISIENCFDRFILYNL